MAEDGYSSGPFGACNAGSGRRYGNQEAGITCGGVADVAIPFPGSSSPGRRWGSCAALGSLSPRSGGGGGARFFFDPVFDDEPRHFLDACFLCRKPLARHLDIYMYRGDTPFCSEECRQEQIEMDEAREERWSLSLKASAPRMESQKKKAPQGIQVRPAGAVLAV